MMTAIGADLFRHFHKMLVAIVAFFCSFYELTTLLFFLAAPAEGERIRKNGGMRIKLLAT